MKSHSNPSAATRFFRPATKTRIRTEKAPRYLVTRLNSLILFGLFIIAAAFLAVPSYSERSSSPSAGDSSEVSARSSHPNIVPAFSTFLTPLPVQSLEGIFTYASD